MLIGYLNNKACKISPSSPNRSALISGISGIGKSCWQNFIELNEAKSGNTVIVIDYSQNHHNRDSRNRYHERTHHAQRAFHACLAHIWH